MEREALRLERTADLFTARLEYERKQGLLLTEQTRMLEDEVKVRKDAVKHAISANNPEEKRLRAQIAALEHQIHLVAASIAETQTCNSGLKVRIDGYRREQRNYRHAIQTLSEDLQEIHHKKEYTGNERLKLLKEDEMQRKRLQQMRSKSAQQQYRQRTQIVELEVTYRGMEENFKTSMLRALETLDPSPVQQSLLQKWRHVPFTQKVSSSKQELDSYQRHIKVLDEAFQHIHEISGIEHLEDVVTSIVKTNEQHTSLYSHMNKLMAEIDSLEDLVYTAKRSITRQKEARESGQLTASTLKTDLQAQVQSMTTSVLQKERHLLLLRDGLTGVFAGIREAVELFAVPEFREIMVTKTHTEDGISSRTVLNYLAEVDAGITSLMTWLAYINGKATYHPALTLNSAKASDHLVPSIRGLTLTLNTETDPDEPKVPLKESEIRSRARLIFDLKFHQSSSTFTSTLPRHDPKRHAITPH